MSQKRNQRSSKQTSDKSNQNKRPRRCSVRLSKLENFPNVSKDFSFRIKSSSKFFYKCYTDFCDFSTNFQMVLKSHKEKCCTTSVFSKFQCHLCPFQSQASRLIRKHIQRDHSTTT